MNPTDTLERAPEAAAVGVATAPWTRLAAAVRKFEPSVVVLVARKAPRIHEALHLDFGGNPLVISDLAIPFVGDYLRGARVAVVDDVVNVGSTIQRAFHALAAAGALECRAFALARSAHCQALEGLDVHYDSERALSDDGLRALAWQTPETLQQLARPYDLDFPIIECSIRPPLRAFTELQAALEGRFPDGRVYDLTTRAGARRGIRRFAIDDLHRPGLHRKVRFYVDERRELCRLVPIQVAHILSTESPNTLFWWPETIWETIAGSVKKEDPAAQRALARLRLYVDSLDYGLGFLSECEDLIFPTSRSAADLDDAALIFGPGLSRIGSFPRFAPGMATTPEDHSGEEYAASPFLSCAERAGLVDALCAEISDDDPQAAFMRIFERVSSLVGASDPTCYRLSWPYSKRAVIADPYLRLCVGPTFFDLVHLIFRACPDLGSIEAARREVTRLVDRFVDSGGVVPTTAVYDGVVYRIYREGEAGLRDEMIDRTLYAWEQYGQPLSLTRLTKLLTILNFSNDDPGGEVRADDRGNTFHFRGSVIDEHTEVGRYLLRTNRLKRAGR